MEIKLLFGAPVTEECTKDIDEWAITKELSIENALIDWFSTLAKYNAEKSPELCFYDYLFNEPFNVKVVAPAILPSSYLDTKKLLPMLVVQEDCVYTKIGSKALRISDEAIKHIGKRYEDLFGIEYLGFQRA